MTHEQLLAAKRETEAKHRALKQEAERVALGAGACGRQTERAAERCTGGESDDPLDSFMNEINAKMKVLAAHMCGTHTDARVLPRACRLNRAPARAQREKQKALEAQSQAEETRLREIESALARVERVEKLSELREQKPHDLATGTAAASGSAKPMTAASSVAVALRKLMERRVSDQEAKRRAAENDPEVEKKRRRDEKATPAAVAAAAAQRGKEARQALKPEPMGEETEEPPAPAAPTDAVTPEMLLQLTAGAKVDVVKEALNTVTTRKPVTDVNRLPASIDTRAGLIIRAKVGTRSRVPASAC